MCQELNDAKCEISAKLVPFLFLIPYSLFGVLTNPLLFFTSYGMFAFPWFKKWEGEM
jgi:hypothetical protein